MGGWHAHVNLGEKAAAQEMQKALLREEKQEVTILDSRHTEWWRREMSQEAPEETESLSRWRASPPPCAPGGIPLPDDPERCCGEGGGRGVHVWERM